MIIHVCWTFCSITPNINQEQNHYRDRDKTKLYICVFAGMYTFRPQGSDPHLKRVFISVSDFLSLNLWGPCVRNCIFCVHVATIRVYFLSFQYVDWRSLKAVLPQYHPKCYQILIVETFLYSEMLISMQVWCYSLRNYCPVR